MPEPNGAPAHKAGGFLNQTTAGLPNWAWILVVAGGIAAAYFLPKVLPNFFGGGSQGATGTTTDTSAQTSGNGLLTVPQGQTPVLPPGVSPLYSPTGNLSAFGSAPVPTTAPAPATEQVMTRGLWAGETDPNSNKTLPIWQSPNADWSKVFPGIPLNQAISVGAPVQGNYYGRIATYYPLASGQGYILSSDLANPPAASTFPIVQQSSTAWPGNTTQMRIA